MASANNINDPEKAKQLIHSRTQKLSANLEKAIASPTLTYTQICEVDHQGLYIIFDDEEILYIGKTNRTGKVRMQELAADFRSHTFNKKLLSKRFKDLGFVFEVLKKETKKEWIDKGTITKEDFKAHQKEVNQYIRQKLKFKFYKEQDERKLISLEHFAIAVFNPAHND
jgi:hypothetical protein